MDWSTVGEVFGYSGIALLCLFGFVLSCLSLSGTWVILVSAGLLSWMRWPDYPGIVTLVLFCLACVFVEILEAFASSWGVQKRGGSKAASWGALIGGFLGMFAGTAIPIPLIGTLLGMMAGSFVGAFLAEQNQMKKSSHAAHVATGAVIARVGVIFVKAGVSLVMMLVLAIGLILSR